MQVRSCTDKTDTDATPIEKNRVTSAGIMRRGLICDLTKESSLIYLDYATAGNVTSVGYILVRSVVTIRLKLGDSLANLLLFRESNRTGSGTKTFNTRPGCLTCLSSGNFVALPDGVQGQFTAVIVFFLR